jgi:NAD(P)H-dependent FMN reductase
MLDLIKTERSFFMPNKIKALAISGSTRQNSSNHRLINAITELFADRIEITIFEGLSQLPHFNPDQNNENVSTLVTDFRNMIRNAAAIIICTPEYAHGIPGSLKNAIDWTVSSGEFSHKPTVLITASTDGKFGHYALLETLQVLEAKNVDQLQLLIPFIQSKFGDDHKLKDSETLKSIKRLMNDLIVTVHQQEKGEYLISAGY